MSMDAGVSLVELQVNIIHVDLYMDGMLFM